MLGGSRQASQWHQGLLLSSVLVVLVGSSVVSVVGTGPHPGAYGPVRYSAFSGVAVGSYVATAWGAGPWPTYLGNPERTGANLNESVLALSNASDLRVLWNATLPGPPEDTPIVDHGVVYASSWDGSLSAYYLSNGTRLWKANVGTSTFSQCYFSGARGPTATATIVNGTVYIMGGDPYFYALNATTGSMLWKVSEAVNSPSSGDYNWGSPLIYGHNAYLGLASACGAPGSQGVVEEINLNGSTHNVTHVFAVVPKGAVYGGVWSTPAIDPAHNLIWITTGDGSVGSTYGQSILALNATTLGLVGFWQLGVNCCDYDFGAGPTLFHDAKNRSLVAALNKNGVVYALNRSNVSSTSWNPVWTTNISWYANTSQGQAAGDFDVAPAAFGGDSLFVGGGFARLANGSNVSGTVRALNPVDGLPRWTMSAPGIVRAGLAYANGLVIDAADYPNNSGATLEVRNATDGTRLFELNVKGTVNGAPSIADGLILFGSGNWSLKGPGVLWALGLPLLARASVLPVVGGAPGTVYVDSNGSGGVPPYSAQWLFGDGTSPVSGNSAHHTYLAPGSYAVAVTLTDAVGETQTVRLVATVLDVPLVVAFFSVGPTNPTVGAGLTLQVGTSGGMGSLSYAYSGLPHGCLDVNASRVSCVPTQAGNFTVVVQVKDAYGEGVNGSLVVNVGLPPTAPLTVVAFWAQPGTLATGQSTVFTLKATGGIGPLSYRYLGLPAGCGSANVSALTCVPSVAGTSVVTGSVMDVQGTVASASLTLVVNAPPTKPVPALQILAFLADPSPARVGENVTWETIVTGGVAPYSFLYTGLPLNCPSSNSSTLSCRLSAAANLSVEVNVRDVKGDSANATGLLVVRDVPPTLASGGATVAWSALAIVGAAAGTFGFVGALLILRRKGREPGTTGGPSSPLGK